MVVSTFTFDEAEDPSDDEDEEEDEEEVIGLPEDPRGLSIEDWEELLNEDQSDIKWKRLDTVDQTRFSIGVGNHMAWRKAKNELQFFRSKMSKKVGSERPGLDTLMELIFGENSALYLEFKSEGVFVNNASFKKFLATLLTSCSYQLSCKELFSKKLLHQSKHFRNAASQRRSFKRSMSMMIDVLTQGGRDDHGNDALVPLVTPTAGENSPVRARRSEADTLRLQIP